MGQTQAVGAPHVSLWVNVTGRNNTPSIENRCRLLTKNRKSMHLHTQIIPTLEHTDWNSLAYTQTETQTKKQTETN